MDPQDDPEARIRALEQPLADTARATELGTGQQYSGGAYVPPTQPLPPPPTSPYGAPPPSYGAPSPYGTPYPMSTGRSVSAGLNWVWFLIAGVVFAVIAVTVGIVVFTVNKATDGISITTAVPTPGAGGTFAPRPGVPTIVIPSIQPNSPSEPTTVPAGGTLTVSGMGQNRTIACEDGAVSVSGMTNTVTITGHCVKLTVSGMQNKIVIDSADAITASGVENQVTYHSGSPDVDKSGGNNIVQQG